MEQHKTGNHWNNLRKRMTEINSMTYLPNSGPAPMMLNILQHRDEIDKLIQQAGTDKSI